MEVHESLREPQSNTATKIFNKIERNAEVNNLTEIGPSTQSCDTASVSAQVSAEHWALGYTI